MEYESESEYYSSDSEKKSVKTKKKLKNKQENKSENKQENKPETEKKVIIKSSNIIINDRAKLLLLKKR